MNRLYPLFAAVLMQPVLAQDIVLPAPTDGNFCQAVQQYMSSTAVESSNTVFTDMPEYRHSKPIVDPLQTFQVISYAGQLPVMVSCTSLATASLTLVSVYSIKVETDCAADVRMKNSPTPVPETATVRLFA